MEELEGCIDQCSPNSKKSGTIRVLTLEQLLSPSYLPKSNQCWTNINSYQHHLLLGSVHRYLQSFFARPDNKKKSTGSSVLSVKKNRCCVKLFMADAEVLLVKLSVHANPRIQFD